jgi:hypothetical protein
LSTDATPLPVDPALADAILSALAQVPEGGMSLPRLCKKLGLRMSVLMRTLAWLGDSPIGGRPGPGWVSLSRVGGRDVAAITAEGRRRLDRTPTDPLHPAN